MQLIITVDAEADNQWDATAPQTVDNLATLERFQQLCDEHGFPPTYLCTYEVVTSPAFERTMGPAVRDGRAEAGAHLHPWSTPPFDRDWDGNGAARPYPLELPSSLLADKLATLTSVIAERIGGSPTSYRAGRWGFSAPQIPLLVALGYEVDCSVTPGVSWRDDPGLRSGGADFTRAGVEPYELAADDVCRPGHSGLLEVPVTILHANPVMRASGWLRRTYGRHRQAAVWRAANRLFGLAPQWLRPYPHMTPKRLIAVCETARRLGLPVMEMMLHSTELVPRDPRSATVTTEQRLDRLGRVLAYLAAHGVKGVTLTAFAREHRTELAAARA